MGPTQFQFVGSRPYDFTDSSGKRVSGVTYYGIMPHTGSVPTGTVGHLAGKLRIDSRAISNNENLEVGRIYDAVYGPGGYIIGWTPAKSVQR